MRRSARTGTVCLLAAYGLASLAACSPTADEGQQARSERPGAEIAADAAANRPSDAPRPSASGLITPGAEDPGKLTVRGLGPIRFGTAPPDDSGWTEDDVQISDTCRTLGSASRPHVYAISDGKVVRRITASEGSGVRTDRGIGIGATEAQVRRAYPDASAEPHKYVEHPAKYLTWIPGGEGPGLRFEIGRDGKVQLIHGGMMPWLGYVEGCA